MRVLVTGVAGFIGFHVASRLLWEGHEVVGLDEMEPWTAEQAELQKGRIDQLCDYGKFEMIKDNLFCLSSYEPNVTHVIHLAAQAGVRHSIEHPHDYVDSNVSGFLEILEFVKAHKCENLVYASSSSVYGGASNSPLVVGDPINRPRSLYAATKACNELMAHSYGHLFDIPSTGLRFFTVYGPWGRSDMFMYIMANKMLRGESLPLFGGDQSRDFTYVSDIVDGILKALDKPQVNAIYNLGSGQSVPIKKVIKYLAEDLDVKTDSLKIDILERQRADVKHSKASIAKTTLDLGWRPRVDIRHGVEKFAEWFLGKAP